MRMRRLDQTPAEAATLILELHDRLVAQHELVPFPLTNHFPTPPPPPPVVTVIDVYSHVLRSTRDPILARQIRHAMGRLDALVAATDAAT